MTDNKKSFVTRAAEREKADIEAELAKYREQMLSMFVQAIGKTSKETEALMNTVSATVRSATEDMGYMTRVASEAADRTKKSMGVLEANVNQLTDATRWTHVTNRISNTIDRWSKPHWALAIMLMILTGVLGVQIGTWTSLKWVEAEVAQANMNFDSVITKETVFRRDRQGRLLVRYANTPNEIRDEGWTYIQEPQRKKGKR